jgi:hypothetical protein
MDRHKGRVKRRAYIIGLLVLLLAVNAIQTSPAYSHIVHSAQNFQRYYNDLKQGDNPLNPIERVLFSLVLANSKNPEQTAVGRT